MCTRALRRLCVSVCVDVCVPINITFVISQRSASRLAVMLAEWQWGQVHHKVKSSESLCHTYVLDRYLPYNPTLIVYGPLADICYPLHTRVNTRMHSEIVGASGQCHCCRRNNDSTYHSHANTECVVVSACGWRFVASLPLWLEWWHLTIKKKFSWVSLRRIKGGVELNETVTRQRILVYVLLAAIVMQMTAERRNVPECDFLAEPVSSNHLKDCEFRNQTRPFTIQWSLIR